MQVGSQLMQMADVPYRLKTLPGLPWHAQCQCSLSIATSSQVEILSLSPLPSLPSLPITGVGGFLPGMKQIANVAALPGIVGVSGSISQ